MIAWLAPLRSMFALSTVRSVRSRVLAPETAEVRLLAVPWPVRCEAPVTSKLMSPALKLFRSSVLAPDIWAVNWLELLKPSAVPLLASESAKFSREGMVISALLLKTPKNTPGFTSIFRVWPCCVTSILSKMRSLAEIFTL